MNRKHLTIDNGQLTFQKEELLRRVLEFGVRIIKLVDKFPKSPAGFKLGSQLVAAATSIGANTHEAQDASSRLDFINKMSIALREAKESKFWLQLIQQSDLLSGQDISSELQEVDELCAIYSTIVKRAKANLSNLKFQMSNESGQSLLEVIIAMTVGILVVTALVFATIFSLRNAAFAKNSAQATKLAQEGIERVRSLRDRDGAVNYTISPGPPPDIATRFNQLWPISCPTYCYFYFNGSTLTGGTNADFETPPNSNFKRQITIKDNSTDQKEFTVFVRWTDFAGSHESKLTTILRKL